MSRKRATKRAFPSCCRLEYVIEAVFSSHWLSFVRLGTGSGIGTYILSLLEDEFPEIFRFVDCRYNGYVSPFVRPTLWNSLPNHLCDPTLTSDSYRRNYLKRGTTCELWNTLSAEEMLYDSALCKFMIDIDIDIGSPFLWVRAPLITPDSFRDLLQNLLPGVCALLIFPLTMEQWTLLTPFHCLNLLLIAE